MAPIPLHSGQEIIVIVSDILDSFLLPFMYSVFRTFSKTFRSCDLTFASGYLGAPWPLSSDPGECLFLDGDPLSVSSWLEDSTKNR